MEAVIFVGIQAAGKSSFFRQRFSLSHVRVNLDMLRTRRKESILVDACMEMPHSFVVDNTNSTKAEREVYIAKAKERHFRVVGYYFRSSLPEALERNRQRLGKERVPDIALRGTHGKLQLPDFSEGFDELHYVTIAGDGLFEVTDWEQQNDV